MNIQSYFSEIREHIINELRLAESSIYIAVAWFTDKELFDILCNKAALGLKVELIAIKDEINTSGSIDFTDLLKNGGKIWLVEDQKTMHNKFCVIDKHIVLNGSYNWTYKASDNHENIMIITNHNETTENYLEQFKQIKIQYFGTEKEAYHKLSLRLAALKNLIQLNDKDDILKQGEKIKSLSLFVYLDQYNKIQSILEHCKSNNYSNAIKIIDELTIEADNFIPEEEIAANTYKTIFDAVRDGSIIGVELFLRKGIDINTQDGYGYSLMHYAYLYENTELIKFLISKNADVNILNSEGYSPIDIHDDNTIANFNLLFTSGAKLNPKSATLANFILKFAENESTSYVISFINEIKDIELFVSEVHFEEVFIFAMRSYNYELARCLISNGFDVNGVMSNGEKLIPSFDFKSEADLHINIERVKFLIEVGADWKSYFGSEVFLNIFYRDLEGIKKSESFHCVNSFGHTPLYYLCLISFDSKNLVDVFVKPAIKFLSQFSPSLITPDYNGVLLIENPICKRWLPIIIKTIFTKTLDLTYEVRDSDRSIKRYENYTRTMNTLFDKLDINTLIIDEDDIDESDEYQSYSKIYTIDGIDYYFKENLLSLAFKLNNLDAVKNLIIRGIDVNSDIELDSDFEFYASELQTNINSDFVSCLEYARRMNYKEIEDLLVEYGAVISEYDKLNNYIDQQKIFADLAKDSEKREKELEKEREKIEQQKIDDQKRKEEFEYNNSNFLKKLVIDHNKKKRK